MIEQIAYISLGALITLVGAIVYYLKVLKPSINNDDKQQELDAKDKEIVEAHHQKALLEKELESVKSNYDTVKDSLEYRR